MKRLNLFIKGNVDVRDSLHSCRIGGELAWNGINDVLRTSHPDWLARVKHETFTRSDALLQATGQVPEAIRSRSLDLGSQSATSQFSRAVFEAKADVIVFSILGEMGNALVRHRKEDFLFFPTESNKWSTDNREWLKSNFEPTGLIEVAESMANFAVIIDKIREQSDAHILFYNMSSINPGETIHCHRGLGETNSTRIRRFNLALTELSEQTGVSIIDVDSLLARKGADALKVDFMHLTPAGYALIAEEVVRVIEDLGVFEQEAA